MTVDQYLAWLGEGPEGQRYELVAGEPVAMAPERLGHARLEGRLWQALSAAIEKDGLPCEALPAGVTVKIDEHTAYEPDAIVHCGEPLPDDAILITAPVIIAEILWPATRARDAGAKLADYFQLPSLHHYLLVQTERPTIIHHRRSADGMIETRIISRGRLLLDPPGLTLDLSAIYRGPRPAAAGRTGDQEEG